MTTTEAAGEREHVTRITVVCSLFTFSWIPHLFFDRRVCIFLFSFVGARSKIRPLLYKRFFVSEEMRKTSLPSRNLCISTLVSRLSTLPRHTGKCVTWILLLPRHPTWILHLPRRRRGSFTFLVTQEVNNVDNTYILVANVDSIVSSSHRNCTTWIFKHPRSSSWILKVPRHTEIS